MFESPETAVVLNASYSQMARCPCGETWPCQVGRQIAGHSPMSPHQTSTRNFRSWAALLIPPQVPGIESACNSVPRNVTPWMGYSVRVEVRVRAAREGK